MFVFKKTNLTVRCINKVITNLVKLIFIGLDPVYGCRHNKTLYSRKSLINFLKGQNILKNFISGISWVKVRKKICF